VASRGGVERMTQQQEWGFRNVDAQPSSESLAGRMNASPTGRQMANDGSFVKAIYTVDPALALISPANGLEVTWDDAGVIKDCKFARETGWKYSVAYS